MPHIRVDSSMEWHYELEGSGEALLFLHGWAVDKRIWRQQSKYFSKNFRVLAIDLPGHGKSDWQKLSLRAIAEDVRVILDCLKIRDLMVVGSSMGGLVALKLYDIIPERVKKLAFVGSLPKFSKSADFPHGLDTSRMRKLHSQVEVAYPSIVNIFFRSLFTRQERESRRFKWLQTFRQGAGDVPLKPALTEYLDIIEHEDLRDILKGVRIPVQFINGTEDEICNVEAVKELRNIIPHARFDFFEQCGHFPFLSKAYEFNAVLEEFIKNDAGQNQ